MRKGGVRKVGTTQEAKKEAWKQRECYMELKEEGDDTSGNGT